MESIPARFEAVEYVLYLRRRWTIIAIACGVAGLATLLATFLMPLRYTSSATILIEPAAGSDPRTLTAISPIYLESLKTFETVATSGTLFERAMEKFHLREPGETIESIKRRVLTVSKLRDTKILEISVTLTDPKQAQAMAQFLAEETVRITSNVSREAGREQMDDLARQTQAAQRALSAAQSDWAKAKQSISLDSARLELDTLIESLASLRRDLYDAEAKQAESPSAATKARMEALSGRIRELETTLAAKNRQLAEATTRLDLLEADLKLKRTSYESALRREDELRASLGFSTERLKVIDPGTVPERPSEPKRALYLIGAVGCALIGSLVYLSIAYGLRP